MQQDGHKEKNVAPNEAKPKIPHRAKWLLHALLLCHSCGDSFHE